MEDMGKCQWIVTADPADHYHLGSFGLKLTLQDIQHCTKKGLDMQLPDNHLHWMGNSQRFIVNKN